MPQPIPARAEVAPEHTWDTASIFSSHQQWQSEIEQVLAALPEIARFQGRLAESPATLADYFAAAEDMLARASKIFIYANMHRDVDTADQAAAAMYDRAIGIQTSAGAATSFANPELLAIGAETLQRWASEEPRLASYSHFFDQLERQRPHVRSAEVEQLLSQLRAPFTSATSIHGTLADADLRFQPANNAAGEPIEIAQGTIAALLTEPDRQVRRTAWERYADAHLANKNAMASCIATGVKQRVFMARARNYPSALDAALGATNIPTSVFHNLIETYRKHLPTWHRYWRVRRRALGLDTLQVYDVKAPLTREKLHVPFQQAVDWIAAGMAPLGDEYVDVLRRGGGAGRWVDIYPNQGKRAGAYSTGTQGTRPFILMSYTDDIFSMSTLAHEFGHSMHSYYTWQTQPQVYARYTIFVAEVASNFNQALVRAHLLANNSDPEFQIEVIEEAMSNFHRYFFVMPILARFELELHQRAERGEALTADGMIGLMAELFREGYGDEVQVDHERVGITWAEFPTHLYLNFYVYQYATGISAAHALAEPILRGDQAAVERYLDFLGTGSAAYPLDALRQAGVEMTSPAPVEQTFALMARLIDQLEQLVDQRSA